MIGPTKSGMACCGSPTDRLMTGLPGSMPAMRSVRRTKGERLFSAAALVELISRWAVIMGTDLSIGHTGGVVGA